MADSLSTRISRFTRRIPTYLYHFKYTMAYYMFRNYTMIPPLTFIANLTLVDKYKHIQGAVVECGVWRGGMIAGMGKILSDNNRHYYVYDSFEGLPDAENIDGKKALLYQSEKNHPLYFDNCTAEMSYVQDAVAKAGIANQTTITKGWFSDTLPQFDKKQPIAILRLDGDFYSSIMECLDKLYDSVVPGGIIILDDYFFWDGCVRAVYDFMSKRGLNDRILIWDNKVCYIEKIGESFEKPKENVTEMQMEMSY